MEYVKDQKTIDILSKYNPTKGSGGKVFQTQSEKSKVPPMKSKNPHKISS